MAKRFIQVLATASLVLQPFAIAYESRDISPWVVDEPGTSRSRGPSAESAMCGNQIYDPLQYTCFDNEFLCPWQNGYPMNRCGDSDKCYLPFRYGCENGNLTELPLAEGPFELVAINLLDLAYVKIQACDQKFWLQSGGSCTLCPAQVGDACPLGVDTVLSPGGYMDVMVPGGQRYFIEPTTGALEFSVPHSGIDPPGAIYDINAIQNGTFGLFPHDGWMACQLSSNDTNVQVQNGGTPWQIFAQLPNLTFSTHCTPATVVAAPWKAPGNSSFAAWEYV